MKRPLYITRPGEVKRQSNAIAVVSGEERRLLPLSMISQLWLFGKVKMSDGTRNFLLENGVRILYLSSTGKLRGILDDSRLESDYRKRLCQYRAFEFARIELAKHFVRRKLESIDEAVDYPHAEFLTRLDAAQTLEEVIGVEGSASVYFFAAVRDDLEGAGIPFPRRSYRPPEDAANSLLSLIYTLHYGYLYALLAGSGYDPYIGYLHHKRGRHAPLASDMMESWRIELTRFVVDLFLEDFVVLEDFDERHRLKSERMREVVAHYSRRFIDPEPQWKKHHDMLVDFEGALQCR